MFILRIAITLLCASLSLIESARSAACCASGTALPSLIIGPQKTSVSAALSVGQVVGDYRPGYDRVYLWPKERKLETQTLMISAAHMISEYSQVGLQIPLLKKNYTSAGGLSESNTLLGDVSLSYAYELVKEIEFSYYKPRVFTSVRAILPTGHSQFETASMGLSDVSGIGQWGVALGSALVKVYNRWDLNVFPEYRYYLPQSFNRDARLYRAKGFQAATVSVNGGYFHKLTKIRFGAGIMPQWLDVRKVDSPVASLSSDREVFCDTSLSTSYVPDDQHSIHLTYVDQTLVGPVSNTTLSRTISLRLQKFWD